jgi:hypothetical protein
MFPAALSPTRLLNRVKAVVRRVAGIVGQRGLAVSAVAPVRVPGPVTAEMRGRAAGWMRARLRALSAVMRRIEAGAVLAAPVRGTRAAGCGRIAATREGVPAEARLPRGFGWISAFEPGVREHGAAFAAWLSEPAMQAKVMAAPERMARVISPILMATGVARPAWFPVVARRGRASLSHYGQGLDAAGPGEDDSSGAGSVGSIPPLAPLVRGVEKDSQSERSFVPAAVLPLMECGTGQRLGGGSRACVADGSIAANSGAAGVSSKIRHIRRSGVVRPFCYNIVSIK